MKIFLFGYGQMGKEVEKIIHQRGHEVAGVYDPYHNFDFDRNKFAMADLVIDFTTPGSAVYNITQCFENNKPIVVGTTGWYHDFDQVAEKCREYNGTIFYAPNFSIGVNILFRLTDLVGKLLGNNSDYNVRIDESHHIHKKDAPSGTATTLANSLVGNIKKYEKYISLPDGDKMLVDENILPVYYKRVGEVIGHHSISIESAIDRLYIEHEAFNRSGFATGTLVAAEWVLGKKGVFTMLDLFDNI